jgi:hypothetical protein
MKIEHTARGFALSTFKDIQGLECSIQDSSNCDPRIWFGLNDINPQITQDDVLVPYTKIEKVLFHDRLHLSYRLTKKLITRFKRFLKDGNVKEYHDVDTYGVPYSLKNATINGCIEIGSDDLNPQIMKGDYIGHGTGWMDWPNPDNAVFTSKMLLHADHIKQIIPGFERFVTTGYYNE